jgi:glycosyltransferase 2 family protein
MTLSTIEALPEPRRASRPWRFALKLAVSLGLLAWIARGFGLKAILDAMAGANPRHLAIAALLLVVSQLCSSWQWGQLLARAGVRVSPWRAIGYTWAAALGNLVLPSGAGGDVARVIGAGRETGQRASVLAATVVDRLLGLLILATLGLAGLVWLPALEGTRSGRAVIVAVVANTAVSLASLVLLLSPVRARAIAWVAKRLPGRGGERAERVGAALDRLREARGMAKLLLVSLAVQSARILAHAEVARALDIRVGLGYFFAFVPLLGMAVSLPISVGGIGVRESLGAFLFGLLGIDAARGSAMQLLAYLLTIAITLPGAVALTWNSRRLPSRPAGEVGR